MILHRFFDAILAWRPFSGEKNRTRRSRAPEPVRRSADGSNAVPRREIFIAVVAGTDLALLPWWYGGAEMWGQFFSLALSLLAFAFLFLPVGYDEWRSDTARVSLRKVVRCVPFWCGLFLIAYMVIQGLNPRYEALSDGRLWVPMPVGAYVRWLPHGVDAPFLIKPGTTGNNPGGMNAFREALVFAPMWLTFTALWCGIRRRRVIVWLVRSVVFSIVALAVFAIGMRAAHEPMLYGRVPVSVGSAFGPFLYQNQGGAFFALGFLLSAGLAIRQLRIRSSHQLRGGEHLVLAAAAMLFACAAVFSGSFGAAVSVLVGLIALVPITWLAIRGASRDGAFSLPAAAVALTLLAGLVFAAVYLSDMEPVWHKILTKFDMIKESKVDDRAGMRVATWAMFTDPNVSWIYGIGAGAYRWMSPEYFSRYPEFMSPSGVISIASYAHFDWLQMLVEWGAVGILSPVVAAGWFLKKLFDFSAWRSALALPLVISCVILAAHSCIDFLLFLPAVNLLFAFTAFVALCWSRDDAPRAVAK